MKEERELPGGKAVVYTTPPDLRANIYLVDRVMGKPTDRHEHDFSDLSDEELIARVQGILAEVAEHGPDVLDGPPALN